MKTYFPVAACLGVVLSVQAQTPTLVKDISTGLPNASSNPEAFTVSGGRAFFAATDARNNKELWVSDGTAGGTHLVVDASPGLDTFAFSPIERVAWNGGLLFEARDRNRGRELWISDGTATGTHLLKDIYPGDDNTNSSPQKFVAVNGRVVFIAGNSTVGQELFVTDGTEDGTTLLKDIRPGPNPSDITWVTPAGNQVFFVASDASNDRELWVTDGTDAGTHRVKDLQAGWSSNPQQLARWGNRVVFKAETAAYGWELWVSDGTDAGTTLIADITSGSNSTNFGEGIGCTPTKVFFVVRPQSGPERLWWSDGTPQGTQLITDGGGQPLVQNPRSFFSDQSRVYLLGDTNGVTSVWTGNGAVGGTIPLCAWGSGSSPKFQTFGSRTIFQNFTAATGFELWSTNGSVAGTALIEDMRPGPTSGTPVEWCDMGNGLALLTMQGNRTDMELWKSTLLSGGTSLLADLNVNNGDTVIQDSASLGNNLIFTTWFNNTTRLWVSDGTEAGTNIIQTLGGVAAFTELNGKLIFAGNGEVWTTDGTVGGTHAVATDSAHRTSFEIPMRMGNEIFYRASVAPVGLGELWATDGTNDGTRLVVDPTPNDSSAVRPIGVANGHVIFAASVPGLGTEPWSTDGTTGNGVMLADIASFNSDSIAINNTTAKPLTFKNKLYFLARSNSGSTGTNLWATDGTPEGTAIVFPAGMFSPPQWLTEFKGRLYFVAADLASQQFGLWDTDGTAADVHFDINFDPDYVGMQQLIATPSHLYFTTNPSYEAVSLWRTDGTQAGTELVDTIWPYNYLPPTIAVLPPDGPVYFFGAHSGTGAELFRTNGTADTTLPVEIIPGPDSSMPLNGRLAGDKFFWQGSDTEHGLELWTVDASELHFDECAVDFDDDGFVTGLDFDLYVQAYESGESASDFDGDGFITGIDYDLYVQAFEVGC